MEENPTTHISVVLSSDATMASEFPVKVNDCSQHVSLILVQVIHV